MSIITISRGSYSHGKEVAEKVAGRLGYECIGREILLEVSKEFNVPEIMLIRAMDDPISVLERFTYGKEKYLAYIQAAIMGQLRKDNIVYHGLAGHFFVREIPHALKVWITASIEERAGIVMDREGVSRKEALRMVQKIDRARRKWSRQLYGIDTWDSRLHDLAINLESITVEDAVDMICETVRLEAFQTTPESRRAMEDLFLAAQVKVTLIEMRPDIEVSAENGVVHVKTTALESQELRIAQDIRKAVAGIPGIEDIKIHVLPITPFRAG